MAALTFEDSSPADLDAPRDLMAIALATAGCTAAFVGAAQLTTRGLHDVAAAAPTVGGLALGVGEGGLEQGAGGADGFVELAGDAAALLHGAEGGEAFDALGAALLDAFDFVDLVADEFEEAGHDLAQGGVEGGQGVGDGGDVGLELGALVGVV